MSNSLHVEHACATAGEGLSYAAGERFESVIRRAGEFLTLASPLRTQPAVRAVTEQVHGYARRPHLTMQGVGFTDDITDRGSPPSSMPHSNGCAA
jgi:hypothetical protein